MYTETLDASRYTRLELYWELCRYRSQLTGEPISDRTFRLWRQRLGIVPDQSGLYWQSDLQRLKETVRRLSQGQTLNQIVQLFKERDHAHS